MPSTIGFGSRNQAQDVANKIMDYWGRRGYSVTAYPYPVSTTVQGRDGDVDNYVGWGVRTDMINGWPRDLYAQRQRAALA